MITGTIKSQVDRIWDAFWSGGISNPLEVIEQMTYLLFIKRLDELHTAREKKANRAKRDIEDPIFNLKQQKLRWSRFKELDPATMYDIVSTKVFPFVKTLGDADSTYAGHMKDARFTIPTPALLAKVVDMLDQIEMADRDTKGDLYEYMLGKIATAGHNGQFRTPRHIIKLMVDMMAPKPGDIICDPACGTAGFLVAAAEYLLRHHHDAIYADKRSAKRFNEDTFHGFDFDSTMLRVGSMNMLLHGIDNPKIENRDALSQNHAGVEEQFSLILANPPFSGSLDYESCASDLLRIVRTKKTELLFVALFERLLRPGGYCAAIVPAGVLESDSSAHISIRKRLIEENNLLAIVSLPHWVFKPYASVATCIVIFQKSSKTDRVWFYRLDNDGFSDGANKVEVDGSDIPDLLNAWRNRENKGYVEKETKHRFVSSEMIRQNNYDLCARVYLAGYRYPKEYDLYKVSDLFEIVRGGIPASMASDGGRYLFATTSEEIKRVDDCQIDGEAIVIPLVSSTGHGHASIKHIHHMIGKFSVATICVALVPKNKEIDVAFVYYYLSRYKDQLLVPLMRGSANVSLSPERLADLMIPMPPSVVRERLLAEVISIKREVLALGSNLRQKELELATALEEFGHQHLGVIAD